MQETIRLFTELKQFNLQCGQTGMKKMLALVWNKDAQIKTEVQNTYWKLYLNPKAYKPKKIADNLIDLLTDTNLTEATSFEEMIVSMMAVSTSSSQKERKKDVQFEISMEVF